MHVDCRLRKRVLPGGIAFNAGVLRLDCGIGSLACHVASNSNPTPKDLWLRIRDRKDQYCNTDLEKFIQIVDGEFVSVRTRSHPHKSPPSPTHFAGYSHT